MEENLFSKKEQDNEPLASRMRPRTIEEYIGQEHIMGPGRLLRRAILKDRLSSVIFYGPPGTGKTTLAKVIANSTKSHFSSLNAVLSGVKDIRDEIAAAKERLEHFQMRTILFVDEVHRWNKSQQDALLPWVENGTFILIGATTENPFFEVNAALVSRSRIFQLKKLEDEDLKKIAFQALRDKERGYGKYKVEFEEGALEHLIDVSSGDARSLLNALELAVETSTDSFPPEDGTTIFISKDSAEESIQKKAVLYDKEGDYHFDVISAFIKSIRGSDPDATLYWLSRMVAAGEDPRFIFRRMLISACEDVGLADPMAIVVVNADAQAFDRIGLPEGRYHLTHSALYLSTAKKSNSALGFFDALKVVEEEKAKEVPNHLRDASRDKEGFGHGEGYLYPHSYRDHWVAQQYLPTGLQGKVFYKPTDIGYEGTIKESVLLKREAQLEAVSEDLYKEHLTYSNTKDRDKWIERALSSRSSFLLKLVDELYKDLEVLRHDNVLVLNATNGLLLWSLMKKNPEGLSVAQVNSKEQEEIILHFISNLDDLDKPVIIKGSLLESLEKIEKDLTFSVISGRNIISRLNGSSSILKKIKEKLTENGKLLLLEAIPSLSSRLSDFATSSLKEKLIEAEKDIYKKEDNLTGWGKIELEKETRSVFSVSNITYLENEEERIISSENIKAWFEKTYSKYKINEKELLDEFSSKRVMWKNIVAIIKCDNK